MKTVDKLKPHTKIIIDIEYKATLESFKLTDPTYYQVHDWVNGEPLLELQYQTHK